jgi:hypothetical protein
LEVWRLFMGEVEARERRVARARVVNCILV